MIPKMIRELAELKRDVREIRQVRSPGILTSQTPRGTVRRANPSSLNLNNSSTTTSTPRWA